MQYYAQTMPGIEKIAWLEIRARLKGATFREFLFTREKNGIVLFDYEGAPGDLLALRTVEDVFALALPPQKLTRDWGDLRALANLVAESPLFESALRQVGKARGGRASTFRVVARKEGQHQYRRKDVGEAIARGIERRYRGRLRFIEEDADVEVWVNFLGSQVLCGLRLSDRSMRHRDYKAAQVEASLRPSVAAAMIVLAETGPDQVFVDPMCGAGTILMERALLNDGGGHILGGDIDRARAAAARRNLAGRAAVLPWDAGRLPLASASVDRIVTNPPFGKKISADLDRLYPAFLAEAARVLRPGGRLILISSEYERVKNLLRALPALSIRTGYSVAVLGQWARIYIIDNAR